MDIHELLILESDLTGKADAMTTQFDILNIFTREDEDEELTETIHPLAFSARLSAEDTPRYHEAMNGPDADGFKEAMETELEQLQAMDSWTVVPREKAIRERKTILATTWAFKRKQYPDGTVKKLKARLCVRGDQQIKGIDYDEVYSPVEAWTTVHILLILSILEKLTTKQIDFTLAFVRAPLKPGTYVEMPKGYELEGHIQELIWIK
jgi:hypothetical protein